jgi:hypothetical protein
MAVIARNFPWLAAITYARFVQEVHGNAMTLIQPEEFFDTVVRIVHIPLRTGDDNTNPEETGRTSAAKGLC